MKDSVGNGGKKRLMLAMIFMVLTVIASSGYAVFWMTGKVRNGLGGEVFPKPVAQRASEEVPKEGSVVETVKIDRQKSVVIVKVPVPTKEEAPPEETARAAWGQLGDFFGGTLNPIFGFISLVLLLGTFCFQIWELNLTRRELEQTTEAQKDSARALDNQNKAIKKQSFEQTFFAWLGTYRQLLGEVVSGDSTGRAALKTIWDRYLEARSRTPTISSSHGGTSSVDAALLQLGLKHVRDADIGHYPILAAGCRSSWDTLYRNHVIHLDSLFRVLYRLLKWIDDQPDESLSVADKWLYVGIVRSQLSWIEMVFLFYNGMTDRGIKFKPLIERYALFDNLTVESDKLLTILKECPMDSVGYSPAAFDSDMARGRGAAP